MSLQNLAKKNNYELYCKNLIADELKFGGAGNVELDTYKELDYTLPISGFATIANASVKAVVIGKSVTLSVSFPVGTIGSTDSPIYFTLPPEIRPPIFIAMPALIFNNSAKQIGAIGLNIDGLFNVYASAATGQFPAGATNCGFVGAFTMCYSLF